MKKYALYLLRWQLSTPLLAGCLIFLHDVNVTVSTIIANLVGGCVFFFIDKQIFSKS